ncbi:MAG: type II secretion system protein [Oscillibacter sp.]|nr:type II secretion system protein [Oscillibacter sp.]
MENLKAKLKKQGGFTMVELLIVVAIIAILVAVSIPMMNNALESSRHAVDQANVRSAIGLASTQYVTTQENVAMYYCVDDKGQGYLSTTDTDAVKPQCTCENANTTLGPLAVSAKPPAADATTDAPLDLDTSWLYDTDAKQTVSGETITVSP